MEGNIIAAIIAVHIATKATIDMPMVPAPLPIACACSSVTIQARAVSARIATHAGAASRSENETRSERSFALKSNVVFDFGKNRVGIEVLELPIGEHHLAVVRIYKATVPVDKPGG